MMKAFRNLLNHINKIDSRQQEQLFWTLKNKLFPIIQSGSVVNDMRETRFAEGFVCPHCTSQFVVRFGKYKGRKRYRCKACRKTFNDLTNTPMHGTRYPKFWAEFIKLMFEGLSLRKCEQILGIKWVTLFYWRHKILNALKEIEIEGFEGIVEVDETYFLYSEKGKRGIVGRKARKRGGVSKYRGISREQVCVLVARDRNKQTVSKVTCMGRIVKSKVEETIGHLLDVGTILCTDAWRAYMTYAKEKGMEHYRINTSKTGHVIKGIYHIQNVNGYHARLSQWMNRFNGVATKYLDHFLAWFQFLEMKGFDATTSNIKEVFVRTSLCEHHLKNEDIRQLNLTI
ncbi:IS1595 family transposase [Bacillus paramycoides]|uniref:IS1595 family transposase n=1 Tax=Bacillus paramycoides TaxID=2026194 RepID=UPI002E1D804C|nr:IS1595 family transposase [Bacillus paramycoides]MED0964083.1 IS1595 family transposase [Bacillus paramycoides]